MSKSDATSPGGAGAATGTTGGLFGRFAKAIRGDWRSRARPAQIPPEDFSVLLLLAGRGAGKTWAAASYVNEQATLGAVRRIALIGSTVNDTRYTMVEGESGIIAAARAAGTEVSYEGGKGLITWPSGAIARCFSADTPNQFRGPEHDLAWCDEAAAWRRAEDTWSNLLLTMRIGAQPRIVVTTTPRPVRLIRDLVARDGTDGIVVRRMSTYDNRTNLAPQFFAQLVRKFEGTRLARQELLAELLEDTPGALWSRDVLEGTRVDAAPKDLQRITIGVDPAGSSAEGADMTGIIACGLGADGEGYVLADLSRRGTPREWASAAIAAYHSLKADKIVIERNFGGEMAAATLASIDPGVPVKEITSSRGKVLRAEPIGSIFEQRRAHIVGTLPELEDQMCSFTADWNRARDGSPDRVDAMTFALTDLMLSEKPGGYIRPEALLAPAPEAGPVPVELPKFANGIFAMVAAGVDPSAPDDIAVVFFSYWLHGEGLPPLVILDWEIDVVTAEVMRLWAPAVLQTVEELKQKIKVLASTPPIAIEPQGLGLTLWQDAQAAHPLELLGAASAERPLMEMPLPQRVLAASAHVNAGRVRITREAYEKTTTHRGVTRNHLLHALAGFGVAGAEQQNVGALLLAFADGVLEVFADQRMQS